MSTTKYIVNNSPDQTINGNIDVVGYIHINGNEIQTVKYKVYNALLTQSGTASPTAIVLENTLGVAVTFEYATTGLYSLQALGALTVNRTFVTFNSVNGNGQTIAYINKVVDGFLITTRNGIGNSTDNVLDLTEIEIRVYLPEPLTLTLGFDNIVNVPVSNASSVSDWNTFFDLPANGTPFTSVIVVGNEVQLIGSSNLILKEMIFYDNTNLISVTSDCIIELTGSVFSGCTSLTTVDLPALVAGGDYCFADCTSITSFNLPILTTVGNGFFVYCTSLTTIDLPQLIFADINSFGYCTSLVTIDVPQLNFVGENSFDNCTSLTSINLPLVTSVGNACFTVCTSLESINLPSCIILGSTVGNSYVFFGITGLTITLTIAPSLMTNNGGNPDGDIQYLQANNTVTIIPATA